MADAYPAFDFRRNNNPGSGSGPMGGPGPFAPGNTPVVYPRGADPIKQFMSSIGVAGTNSEGIPVGSTGGTTFMWNDQVEQVNQMAGAPVMGSQGRVNPFLAGSTPQPQQPAAAPTNTFLPGAPTATGDVRFNGLTPATLAPGGTPMIGRNYGSQPTPSTLLSTFGQRLLATGGTETRDGAVFSGAGGKLSITQDPSTVPARGAATGGLNLTPGAMAIISQGISQFKGPDATNQFMAALDSGAFDQKPLEGATTEQIAALSLTNQRTRQEAKAALPRMMLPNTGNAGVDAERMKSFMGAADNAFMPKPAASTGAVDKLAKQATGSAVDYNESLTAFTEMAKKNGQVVTTQVQIDKSGRPTVQATFHDAKTLDDGNKKRFDELSRERTAIVSRLAAIDTNVVNNATAGPMKGNVDKERKRLAKIEQDLNELLPGSVVPYGQEEAGAAPAAPSGAPALTAGVIYPDANGNLAKFKGGDPKDAKNWEPVTR